MRVIAYVEPRGPVAQALYEKFSWFEQVCEFAAGQRSERPRLPEPLLHILGIVSDDELRPVLAVWWLRRVSVYVELKNFVHDLRTATNTSPEAVRIMMHTFDVLEESLEKYLRDRLGAHSIASG